MPADVADMDRTTSEWQDYDHHLALQLHADQEDAEVVSRAARSFVKTASSEGYGSRVGAIVLADVTHVPVVRPSTAAQRPNKEQAAEARGRLMLRVDMYALYDKPIQGDGNCQFRAVSDQLYASEDLHAHIREMAVAQLRARPKAYREFVPDAYAAYVAAMARGGTWGDHLTLKALADRLGVHIYVLTSYREDGVIHVKPEVTRSQRVLWLSFWAEVHYGSLYPGCDRPPSAGRPSSGRPKRVLGSRRLGAALGKHEPL